MSKQKRSETGLIKLKLKKFGARSAILKAIEETSELLCELEILLQVWDAAGLQAPKRVAHTVANIAEEYADVTVAVYDTFKRIWVDEFAQIVEKKRRLVYEERLPQLLDGDDNVE
jgi:hypothetical protein